jgi:hypothetical protein
MKTESGDSIYHGKDGRLRVYVRETGKTISYPKYLMEKELGRQLKPNEFVHHKDLNPLHNEMSNLVVMTDSEHAREHMKKYYDTTAICGWCGKEFVWTAKHQKNFYSNKRNHGQKSELPFCSRECSGRYGRHNQDTGANPMRKLNEEQVQYIRENYIQHDRHFGSRALARQFDVDRTVVNYIIKGRTYKDVL